VMKYFPVQTPAVQSRGVGEPTEVIALHELLAGSYTPPPPHGTQLLVSVW